MEHINALNINQEIIRENIDNSIIEQLLSDLINKTTFIISITHVNSGKLLLLLLLLLAPDKNGASC